MFELPNQGESFNFVNLKIKQIDERDIALTNVNDGEELQPTSLIQVIDVSSQVKEKIAMNKQAFQQMVNATVSHELKNPLSAITEQKQNYKHLADILQTLIANLLPINEKSQFVQILLQLEKMLVQTNKNLFSAAKFIEFFVHGMLDYSILQNSNNFMKDM